MSDIEQTIEVLQRRVEALERENARLRQPISQAAPPPAGTTRRQLLREGLGALGLVAGGALAAAGPVATAAAAEPAAAPVIHEDIHPVVLGLQVTLTPLKTRGVLWAEHEWELGTLFDGEQAPVVVATALDDHMATDVSACCTCAVAVHGEKGSYRATIMVRNISPRAREVVVNAVAIGQQARSMRRIQ